MKRKYKHKGSKQFQIINHYDECFGPGTKAQAMEAPKEQIDMICKACKNITCTRSGRGSSTWNDRMSSQVEWLLNNPIFSDMASHFHKEMSSVEIKNLKQKIEQITVNAGNTAGSGWETADIKPDSSNSVVIPNTQVPPKPDPIIIAPQKQPIKNPVRPKNTPLPSGGVMIGGGDLPGIVKPIDPWQDADKIIKPGATVTIKTKKEPNE